MISFCHSGHLCWNILEGHRSILPLARERCEDLGARGAMTRHARPCRARNRRGLDSEGIGMTDAARFDTDSYLPTPRLGNRAIHMSKFPRFISLDGTISGLHFFSVRADYNLNRIAGIVSDVDEAARAKAGLVVALLASSEVCST